MTLKTSINAKHLFMLYSSDFCVNLIIPSEKATVIAAPHSLALNRQHYFDVRDRHQCEAGKSAIGLNVADF